MIYIYLFVTIVLLIALPIGLGYHYEHHRNLFDEASDYFAFGFFGVVLVFAWPMMLALAALAVPFWLLFKLPAFLSQRKITKNAKANR